MNSRHSPFPDNIRASYRQQFGSEPALIVRAPGRINLIGEHTDYNQGYVLPAAIEQSMWFAIGLRGDNHFEWQAFDLKQHYAGDTRQILCQEQTWANYLLGVVDQLQKAGHCVPGFNLVFGGEIPTGSGLSSSAALESGLAFALNTLLDLGLSRPELALLSQRAENEFVGMNCGIMDMYASLMGRRQSLMRLDCRNLDTAYFPMQWADHSLVLCNSGVKHKLVDSGYNNRREQCEAGVRYLQQHEPGIESLRDVTEDILLRHKAGLPALIFSRCRFVVRENARVLQTCEALLRDDVATIGQLLYKSHAGLQYDYAVSCPEMDFLVDATRDLPYVAGSRMMGGGFGGCTINIVEKASLETFMQHIRQVYRDNWQIEADCLEVHIGEGCAVQEVD